jgi:hypothetical protein
VKALWKLERTDQERKRDFMRISEASKNGSFKSDYGGGLVKICLSGSKGLYHWIFILTYRPFKTPYYKNQIYLLLQWLPSTRKKVQN